MSGVKWYSSLLMPGAPQLTGANGTLISVMDACLVNGFGAKTITSLVIAGGVATATVSGGHTFVAECVARVAGATVTGGTINGEHRVQSTAINAISWLTDLPDQVASVPGTIDVAPAGWEKYSGVNKAAYRSTSLSSRRFWLRVDDTLEVISGYAVAQVRGYESMTDVDTGVRPFPTVGQVANSGLYWTKSNSDTSTPRAWAVYADEAFVLVCLSAHRGSNFHVIQAFGDFLPSKVADPYACFINGGNNVSAASDSDSSTPNSLHLASSYGGNGICNYLPRSHSGLGGAIEANRMPSTLCLDLGGGARMSGGALGSTLPGFGSMTFPNPANNSLLLARIMVYEGVSGNPYRGILPGLLWVPQAGLATMMGNGDIVDGSGEFAGRRLQALRSGWYTNGNVGAVMIDITGPWR